MPLPALVDVAVVVVVVVVVVAMTPIISTQT
jgi:hypothetical protein